MTDVSKELLPCRACGSPCRVERFEGGAIEVVCTIYICANSTKFGGDCPDPHAYLNVNAWNTRAQPAPADAVTDEQIIEIINLVTDLAEADALDRAIPEVRVKLSAIPVSGEVERLREALEMIATSKLTPGSRYNQRMRVEYERVTDIARQALTDTDEA
jgi:hypothetical protein